MFNCFIVLLEDRHIALMAQRAVNATWRARTLQARLKHDARQIEALAPPRSLARKPARSQGKRYKPGRASQAAQAGPRKAGPENQTIL